MRTMYDSVNASAIPKDAQLVGGYVDGLYAWSAADWARFPNALHVTITVDPAHNTGVVLDVEQGDARPDQAPGWVQMRRTAGVDPTVYCSESAWPTVQAAFNAARVPQPHYWVAAYPGEGAVIPAGAVAHQYASDPNIDTSVVADYWPGVDPTPAGDDVSYQDAMNAITDYMEKKLFTSRADGKTEVKLADVLLDNNAELYRPYASAVAGSNYTAHGLQFAVNADKYGFEAAQALAAIQAQLTAIQGAVTKEEADFLAALKNLQVGSTDVTALAALLTQSLPAAVVADLGTKLAAK